MKILIFGGTFDPIHEGHIGVIREVLSKCDLLVIAPTEQNPWKKESGASFEQRIEMLEKVLSFEKIEYSKEFNKKNSTNSKKVLISEFHYSYARDLVFWLRETFEKKDNEITWVVGPDIASEVNRWKDWETLDVGVYVAENYADDLHSTEVRKGEKKCHQALTSYISANKLYAKKALFKG